LNTNIIEKHQKLSWMKENAVNVMIKDFVNMKVGKLRCEKHHLEAKRIANIKFEKNEKLKKYGIIIAGIIGVVIGAIVIYRFVANL